MNVWSLVFSLVDFVRSFRYNLCFEGLEIMTDLKSLIKFSYDLGVALLSLLTMSQMIVKHGRGFLQ